MVKRTLTIIVAASALSLGMAACTEAEQERTEVKAEQAGEAVGDAAAQAGEVIESGTMKAARAVEEGAGKLANKLEENQAEAAAEGRAGAVNPATGERVE